MQFDIHTDLHLKPYKSKALEALANTGSESTVSIVANATVKIIKKESEIFKSFFIFALFNCPYTIKPQVNIKFLR
jgi:hypothetical protein